jgi:polyisoprenoid-binding protein YceI
MMQWLSMTLLAGAALLLAACATPVPAAPESVAAPGGSGAASPTGTAAAPAPTATAPVNGAIAAASVPPGGLRFTLVAAQSEARYRVREQLASLSFPNDAVGVTKSMQGAIVFDQNGAVVAEASRFVVDVNTLKSDESRRDNFLRRNSLETDRFPTATFVPKAVEGLPWPLPASGEAVFQLTGDLTVHGVTAPATWQAKATFAGQEVTGQAVTSFRFADFGMQVPRVAVVLSVEDKIQLELDFQMARTA